MTRPFFSSFKKLLFGFSEAPTEFWLICLCAAGSFGTFAWFSNVGFSFRDDTFYLIWAADPFAYANSLSDFGYFWHPLYRSVGGNIALFRVGGLLTLSASAICFALALVRVVNPPPLGRAARTGAVVAILASEFWYYFFWNPTPSYNSLNLVGLLLFYSGLLLVTNSPTPNKGVSNFVATQLRPAVLSGLGLALSFLAKPPTCLPMILIGSMWLVLLRPKGAVKFFLTAVATTFLVVSIEILTIHKGFVSFAQSKLLALTLLRTISGDAYVQAVLNSVLGAVPLSQRISQLTQFLMNVIGIVVVGGIWSHQLLKARALESRWSNIFVYGAPLLLAIWVTWARADGRLGHSPAHYALYATAISELLLFATMTATLIGTVGVDGTKGKTVVAASLIALGPFAYAFSSSVTLIVFVGTASLLWTASMLLIATTADRRENAVLITGLLCSLMSSGLWLAVSIDPDGEGVSPLFEQSEPIVVGPQRAIVYVGSEKAQLIRTLRQAATANAFEVGTPIIDLTTEAPGEVFAMGGVAPGAPWLAPDQWDNPAYIRALFSTVPARTLRRAWLLSPPLERKGTAFSALRIFGLRFPENYRLLARAHYSDGSAKGSDFLLWRPDVAKGNRLRSIRQ